MKKLGTLASIIVLSSLMLAGCETLRTSKPIMPMRAYERMIVGRLDANYVGTRNCLASCHYHDKIKRDFDASTMGAQLSAKSGLPLVNCESCHGPGSLAIKGLTPQKVAADAKKGIRDSCNYKTLIDIKDLPPAAQSLICLKCHSANATFNLHDWNAGTHAINGVSCEDCHNIHAGPDLKVRPRDTEKLCERCHQDVMAQFRLPNHHPVPEKRIFCTDCHNPHGTLNDHLLRKPTVKQTCTQCHAEKEGPFLYEHAENTENCLTCHRPHGSVYANLLTISVPFLCLQCHTGHSPGPTSSCTTASCVETRRLTFYTRCTDCHSQIHGTDLPSESGSGRFTQ